MKRFQLSIALVLAILLLASCAARAPRSGALTILDSDAYDGLIVAQAALTEAKQQFALGELPPSAKDVINKAGAAYNVARASWLTWRDGLAAGRGDEAAKFKLVADVALLTAAVAAVFKLKGGAQP